MKKLTLNGKKFIEVFTEKMIASLVAKLAQQIKNDYERESAPLVYLYVTNGGIYIGVALSQASYDIGLQPIEETIRVSRYIGDKILRKKPLFVAKPLYKLKGCNVIVIDDVQEEGKTLEIINDYLLTKKCKSIQYCVLLAKRGYPQPSFPIKYVGKRNIPKNWLTGYGMDSWDKFRGLRSIYKKIN
jgi:hypoxanthine phosphoribosyltransferase